MSPLGLDPDNRCLECGGFIEGGNAGDPYCWCESPKRLIDTIPMSRAQVDAALRKTTLPGMPAVTKYEGETK